MLNCKFCDGENQENVTICSFCGRSLKNKTINEQNMEVHTLQWEDDPEDDPEDAHEDDHEDTHEDAREDDHEDPIENPFGEMNKESSYERNSNFTKLIKGKNKNKIFLISLPVFLIFMAVLLVLISSGTSAKKLFFNSYEKTLVQRVNANPAIFETITKEFSKKLMKESSEGILTINPRLSVKYENYQEIIDEISGIVNSMKIFVKSKEDKQKNIAFYEFDVQMEQESVLKSILQREREKIIAGLPNILEKYFSTNLKDAEDSFGNDVLASILRSFDSEKINPEKLIQALDLSGRDLKDLQREYYSFLVDYFDEKEFSLEKKTITVEGKQIKANRVALRIQPERMKEFIQEFEKRFAKDKKLQDAISKRANSLIGILNGSELFKGLEESYDFNILTDQKYITAGVINLTNRISDRLKSFLEEVNFTKDIIIDVNVDPKGRILQQDISLNVSIKKTNENIQLKFMTKNYETKEGNIEIEYDAQLKRNTSETVDLNFRLKAMPDSNKTEEKNLKITGLFKAQSNGSIENQFLVNMDGKWIIRPDGDESVEISQGKIQVGMTDAFTGKFSNNIQLDIHNLTARVFKSKLKESALLKMDITVNDLRDETTHRFGGKIDLEASKDEDEKEYQEKIDMEFFVNLDQLEIEAGLGLDTVIRFTKNPRIDTIDPELIVDMESIEQGDFEDDLLEELLKYYEDESESNPLFIRINRINELISQLYDNEEQDNEEQDDEEQDDEERAEIIENALKTMLIETSITDIVLNKDRFKLAPRANAPSAFAGSDHNTGVKELIVALQQKIYIQNRTTGEWKEYGPYLTNPDAALSVPQYSSYAPRWNPGIGGKHVGYHIRIWPKKLSVSVTPAMAYSESEQSPDYDPKGAVNFENSVIESNLLEGDQGRENRPLDSIDPFDWEMAWEDWNDDWDDD
jgi:hypothetical protein